VKVLQIVEREKKHDDILFERIKEKGEDPFDDKHNLLFRRYKERLFQSIRDSVFMQFEKLFPQGTTADQALGK
jgi:hypothetical protein